MGGEQTATERKGQGEKENKSKFLKYKLDHFYYLAVLKFIIEIVENRENQNFLSQFSETIYLMEKTTIPIYFMSVIMLFEI